MLQQLLLRSNISEVLENENGCKFEKRGDVIFVESVAQNAKV